MPHLNASVLTKYVKLHGNGVAILVIVLFSLNMLSWMGGYLVAVWDHILTPFKPELSIMKDWYVWDYSTLGGQYFVYLPDLLYHGIVYVISFVMPVGWANAIVFWLYFLMCGLSMYFFVRRTLRLDESTKPLVALIASLTYMFNPYWFFQLDIEPLPLFILAFLPLLMLALREALMSSSMRRTVRYSMLASLITVPMTSGLRELAAGVAAMFLVGVYLVVLATMSRVKLKSLVGTLILFPTFFLSVHLWWIIPAVMHRSTQEAITKTGEYVVQSLGGLQISSQWMTYFNVLRGLGYYFPPSTANIQGYPLVMHPPDASTFNSGFFVAISLLVPVVGFTALFSKRVRESSEILVFALVAVISIPLLFTALNPPLGFVVVWLVEHVPIFAFRRPQVYMFVLQFAYAYMFGLGVLVLCQLTRKIGGRRPRRLLEVTIIVSLLVLTVFVNAFPQWLGHATRIDFYDESGKIRSVSTRVQVPDYVEQVVGYLNTVPQRGGVLVLPMVSSMRAYDWKNGYFGFDVYYLSLKRPVLAHNFGEPLQRPTDAIYDFIDDYVYRNGARFVDLLMLLNIKYVIVADDALRWGSATFNINQIHEFLSQSKDIRLVDRFGNHTLYETTKTPEEFYAVTESLLKSGTIAQSLSSLLNQKEPTRIALVNSSEEVLSYNEAPPKIVLNELSPINFRLQVLDAKSPFLLVSTILYDNGWMAEVDGNELDHIKVNGVFNGWIVKQEGNFTVHVYYLPQVSVRLFENLSVISAALMLTTLSTRFSSRDFRRKAHSSQSFIPRDER